MTRELVQHPRPATLRTHNLRASSDELFFYQAPAHDGRRPEHYLFHYPGLLVGIGFRAAARPFRQDRTAHHRHDRSEEHTSELQSLMRISYAVFCLKKKTKQTTPVS